MKFKIQGVATGADVKLPALARKVKAFLGGAKDGEMWNTMGVGAAVGVMHSTITTKSIPSLIPEYTTRAKIVNGDGRAVVGRLWANPATIKAYNEQS